MPTLARCWALDGNTCGAVVPDGTSVFSCMPTVTLVSTTHALVDESTQERERMYRRRVTGGALTTAAATEEGESPESLDFVHSWSEADSQELPTPSQKPLTAVPEDMEVYYSETDEDALEEERRILLGSMIPITHFNNFLFFK